jgi:hypothetical protein
MKTRQDLQNDIKTAKANKKAALYRRNEALKTVKAARAGYKNAAADLDAHKDALVAFDKGERPAK